MASKFDNLPLNPQYIKNLEQLWNDATPKERLTAITWWPKFRDMVLNQAVKGVDFKTLAAMTACMSPGITYTKALEYAEQIYRELNDGKKEESLTLYGAYGWNNIKKAVAIYTKGAGVLEGQKVLNVFNNIMEPENPAHVSIGRIEKIAVTGDYLTPEDQVKVSKYEYPYLAKHYQFVARKLDIPVTALQALVNHEVVALFTKTKVANVAI